MKITKKYLKQLIQEVQNESKNFILEDLRTDEDTKDVNQLIKDFRFIAEKVETNKELKITKLVTVFAINSNGSCKYDTGHYTINFNNGDSLEVIYNIKSSLKFKILLNKKTLLETTTSDYLYKMTKEYKDASLGIYSEHLQKYWFDYKIIRKI